MHEDGAGHRQGGEKGASLQAISSSVQVQIAEYEKAPEAGQEKIQKLKDTLADAEQAIQENSAELERRLASVEEQTAELCAQKKIAEADVARHTAQEDEVGGQVRASLCLYPYKDAVF